MRLTHRCNIWYALTLTLFHLITCNKQNYNLGVIILNVLTLPTAAWWNIQPHPKDQLTYTYSPPPCSLRAIKEIKWLNERRIHIRGLQAEKWPSEHPYEGATASFVAIRLYGDWWRAGPQPSLFVTFHPAALTMSWGLEGGMCHQRKHLKCHGCPVVVTNISVVDDWMEDTT